MAKQIKVREDNYFAVQGWMVTELKLKGIPTGIPKLDEITNGWLWGEDLVVLTGRTNVGKTWIGEYFATVAWNMGYKILMYSGEMSTAMVGFRFDTLNKHFSNMGLLNGSGTLGKKPDTDGAKYLQEDYEKYITQLQQKSGFIVVTPDDFEGRKPNVDEIKSLAIKHGADMIVIDQLSLMSDKRRADIPRIAYNNISEDLFLMSKELKKPVLLMAQANREAVKNRKKGESPELHDLAESDGVGQNATRVLSLSVIDGTLKISVKKNRYLMDVSLKQKAYIENLEAELNECKMLNNQLMSDLDADEGLAEICVNEFIADTIKAVKDAGVKKITVEF